MRYIKRLAFVSMLAIGLSGAAPAQYGRYDGDREHRRYQNNAYQVGLRDGQMDGRHDRMTGHSFRPTHDSNYRHADRGWNSSYGNRQAYKNEYRAGYSEGYRQGYGRY